MQPTNVINMVEAQGPVCYYYFHLKVTCYEIRDSTASFHNQILHKKEKLPKIHLEPQFMCIKSSLKRGLPWFQLCYNGKAKEIMSTQKHVHNIQAQ
jgi:hypothetical protein